MKDQPAKYIARDSQIRILGFRAVFDEMSGKSMRTLMSILSDPEREGIMLKIVEVPKEKEETK